MRIVLPLVAIFALSSTAQAQEVYRNPADGTDYIADKWNAYNPDSKSNSSIKNTAKESGIEKVVLLSTQSDFEEIGVQPFADYTKSLEKLFKELAKKYDGNGQVLAQVELTKDSNPNISISYNGDVSKQFLQSFYDEASKISFKTKTKTLTFQVWFNVVGKIKK